MLVVAPPSSHDERKGSLRFPWKGRLSSAQFECRRNNSELPLCGPGPSGRARAWPPVVQSAERAHVNAREAAWLDRRERALLKTSEKQISLILCHSHTAAVSPRKLSSQRNTFHFLFRKTIFSLSIDIGRLLHIVPPLIESASRKRHNEQ